MNTLELRDSEGELIPDDLHGVVFEYVGDEDHPLHDSRFADIGSQFTDGEWEDRGIRFSTLVCGSSIFYENSGDVWIPAELLRMADNPDTVSKLSVEEQQRLAFSVLAKVRCIDINAVVAGGAASDWYRGDACRDVDIFFSYPSYYTPAELKQTLRHTLGVNLTRVGQHYDNQADNGALIVHAANINGLRFEFAGVQYSPLNAVNTFPYNHSAIYWDGNRFNASSDFSMFSTFNIVIKRYEPNARYKAKVERKVSDNGWIMCNNFDEALDKSVELTMKQT